MSVSYELKKQIKQIMNDNKIRNIREIKKELANHGMVFGKDYNANHISGVLKVLRISGYLELVERGIYQKKNTTYDENICTLKARNEEDKSAFDLYDTIQNHLSNHISFIKRNVQQFNISDLSSNGLSTMSEILQIIEVLKKIQIQENVC